MSFDISKLSSDYLRSSVLTVTGSTLQASHARELVAAYFGYKSHAALLAEKKHSVNAIGGAKLLVPAIPLIEDRRKSLQGLPSGLYSSREIAAKLSDFLVGKKYFTGKVEFAGSVEIYVTEDLLLAEDAKIMNDLSGVMAETNAQFGMEFVEYEVTETLIDDDLITLSIEGKYYGTADDDRPFCGDQIDVTGTVELPRVAGHVAFGDPDIHVTGEVNQDWVDPALRFGTPETQPDQQG